MSNKNKKIILEKLPANLQKKVGNTLMGDPYTQKGDDIAKLQKRKTEPNSSYENDLYHNIVDWVGQSSNEIAKYFKKNKDLLDTLAKEFPEVLKAPMGELAYRGTQIKATSLFKTIKNSTKAKFVKIRGTGYLFIKNVPYSPYRESQSWTVDSKTAANFNNDSDSSTIHVIYVAKVNKDFIFSPKLMNIVFTGKEHETVRVAKKGKFDAFIHADILDDILYDGNDKEGVKTLTSFISKFAGTAKFFEPMVDEYNKLVEWHNKNVQREIAKNSKSNKDSDWDDDSGYSKYDLKKPIKTFAELLKMHAITSYGIGFNQSENFSWDEFYGPHSSNKYFALESRLKAAWKKYLASIK